MARQWLRLVFFGVKNDERLNFLAVFLFFALINALVYFTVSNVSSSDDQWFYFKIAKLLSENGFDAIRNFQGAYFTELSQSGYSYAVGLYHYFFIPFTFFGGIIGLKIAGFLLATAVPVLSCWVLRKFEIKWAFVWVVLFFYFFGGHNFAFRMFLNRPFVIIDALVLFEIYLISQRKHYLVFFVSLLHVWWHPATFWLPFFLAVCFEVILLLYDRRSNYRTTTASLAGSLGAFLLFPSHSHTFLSPLNPMRFLETLFSFVYGLGSGPKIIEGAENYKGDVLEMLQKNEILFACMLFFIVISIAFYIHWRRNDKEISNEVGRVSIVTGYIFLIVIVFLLGFVFSKRFEDLLVPLVMLGTAIIFQALWRDGYIKIDGLVVKKSVFVFLGIFIFASVGNEILNLRQTIGSDDKHLKYEKAGEWFRKNTEKGEIIFNTDFGQFNRLFFYNSDNRYIVGIEPKNMYEYDKNLYWLWHNITLYGVVNDEEDYGKNNLNENTKDKSEDEIRVFMVKNSSEISSIIKNRFQSRYIFFDGESFFKKEVAEDKNNYNLAYEDKDGGISIYEIK